MATPRLLLRHEIVMNPAADVTRTYECHAFLHRFNPTFPRLTRAAAGAATRPSESATEIAGMCARRREGRRRTVWLSPREKRGINENPATIFAEASGVRSQVSGDQRPST